MMNLDDRVAPSGRRRWTIRRMMVAVALVAVGLFVLRPVYFLADSMCHGPLTRAFDRDCQRRADQAHLVGKTEAEAMKVLGEPAEIWEYDRPQGRTTTLAYSPSQFSGSATFQVHCRGGIVQAVARGKD